MAPTESVVKNPNFLSTILIAALVGIVSGGATAWAVSHRSSIALTTPYQAVLLNNGTAYFGKLQGLGGAYPVLREVYYIQKVVNPETKQESNVLVKRGREMHAPDYMILNAADIVLVEPVTESSRVAALIAEQKLK